MSTREKRVIDAADELLRLYPDDFTKDFRHNQSKLRDGNYFEGEVSKGTINKIAGAIAHEVGKYDLANPDWRKEMKESGRVSGSEEYNPRGTESAGKEKPRVRMFHRY